MLPIYTGDVYTCMSGFIGHDHILWKIILIADNPNVKISGVFGAHDAFDTLGFMKIGCDSFGRDADVVLFWNVMREIPGTLCKWALALRCS